MVADSERNADMLYGVGMFIPDPFIWFEHRGKTYAVLSDLEIDRARKNATVDRVLRYERYRQQLQKNGVPSPRLTDVLLRVLKERRIRQVQVPRDFPIGVARRLHGVRVKVAAGEFFPGRGQKTPAEVRHLQQALELAESGMRVGLRVVRQARIGRDGYLYWRGEKLTSGHVRGVINAAIAGLGGVAVNTIVACGNQACDPHETGRGPLRAQRAIIVDIFPRDLRTGYWGDITRTVVRGRASDKLQRMFAAVHNAQELVLRNLKAGVDGQDIHNAVRDLFHRDGFRTGRRQGRMQGFFHGTGHGLGLEIHEAPRVSAVAQRLQAGHVVTVEPGLYYWGVGGVRLEDVAVVQKNGARNLTTFPKFLEL
jgi:Xaa-Pro aminopeptidase